MKCIPGINNSKGDKSSETGSDLLAGQPARYPRPQVISGRREGGVSDFFPSTVDHKLTVLAFESTAEENGKHLSQLY